MNNQYQLLLAGRQQSEVAHGVCSGRTVKRGAMDGKERSAIFAVTSKILV